MKQYEENTSYSNKWGWIYLFLLSFFVIGWAMVLMFEVKDVPRKWDYGTVIDAPAENIYTTERVSIDDSIKQQIENFPELNENEIDKDKSKPIEEDTLSKKAAYKDSLNKK